MLFYACKVEEQQKKGGDKSAAAIVKSVRQLSCVSQDAEPPESVAISRKGTSFGTNFDEHCAQELHSVKQSSEKIKVHR